ncbi:MAG: succinate dehydrogenase/fumarate reductase iron-sulfur subunit [Bdellovibrionales bacterium]|nr:succinate dehydrogenase/fumarate reductase iron-sulfur subunit [Bdellovibrionales bacterium]
MKIHLKVWRQSGPNQKGRLEDLEVKDVSPDSSFLEMLDVVNEGLEERGKEPIVFDHDCREGICGACSLNINGVPHGPDRQTTTCQLHMRSFKDGDTIVVEPFRARAFPVIKDLMVDRSAFDRIIQAGGYVSVSTGGVPDANGLPVAKDDADEAFENAACIGCGACVATCKNASASLFVSAKLSHLRLLPQGKVEAKTRVLNMTQQMEEEGFGACTNTGDCEAVCPKGIAMKNISSMNVDLIKSLLQS